nr:unnamed protein product [Leishmania braziliensis]
MGNAFLSGQKSPSRRRTKHARKVYEAVLDHLWAATALARVGDGVAHGLTDTAVGQQRVRHKLTPLQPYSVQEMLKLLRKKIHMVDASPTDPNGVILREEYRSEEVTLDSSIDELYLVRGPSLPTLYDVIKGYRFLLGACLREAPADVNGVRYPSHYVLTKDASGGNGGSLRSSDVDALPIVEETACPTSRVTIHSSSRSAASEAHQDPSDGQRPRLVKRKRWPGDGAGRDPLQEDEEDGATYRTPGNQKGDGYADVDANNSRRGNARSRKPPLQSFKHAGQASFKKRRGRGLPEETGSSSPRNRHTSHSSHGTW